MSLESKIVKWSQYQLVGETDLNNVSKFIVDTIFRDLIYFSVNTNIAVLGTTGVVIQDTGSNYTTKVGTMFGLDKNGEFLINKAQKSLNHTTPVTNPRIDIIQCQKTYLNQNQQTRNFIDPGTGIITPQSTYTEQGLDITVQIKTGVESATPSAPAVDVGWTKLAEVFVDTTGGIATGDIFNVDKYHGENNTGWTNEQTITQLYRSLQTHRTLSTLDHPLGSVTEAHLDATLQAKINQSAVTGDALVDKVITNNLLDAGRDNESMEYFFGTGDDSDYTMTKVLTDKYEDNLLYIDDDNAINVAYFDDNNTASSQVLSNLACAITTSLFDVYLDAVKVMTALNNDYDWTLEQVTPAINDGLISLRPQTTWGAFASGVDSANPTDKKIIEANDGVNGLERDGGGFVDIEILFQKVAFDRHFQGTSLNIVITRDGQVYKWDGVGNPANALIEPNYVFGYEMYLTADPAVGGAQLAGSGLNDAGWKYRRITSDRHRVYVPKNYRLLIGKFNPGDCVGSSGDRYFDEFGSKAYQLKTQVVLDDGFQIDGYHRFLSIIKYNTGVPRYQDWPCFIGNSETKYGIAFGANNPCQISWYSHPFVDGDYVVIHSSSDTDELPNGRYQVTVIDANTISVPVDNSTGSGGTCNATAVNKKNVAIGEKLTIMSSSNVVVPIQIDGIFNSSFDCWDISNGGTAYNLTGNGYTKNIKVHEDIDDCDGVDLNALYGKGLKDLLYS